MFQTKTNHKRVLNQLNQIFKDDKNIGEYEFNKVAYSSINKGYLQGRQIKRIIFYLRGKSCEWCSTKSGGCFMCGHYHGTKKGKNFFDANSHYE